MSKPPTLGIRKAMNMVTHASALVRRAAKGSWCTLCVLALLMPVLRHTTQSSEELDVFFVISMVVLTFPSGLLIGFAAWCVYSVTGLYMPSQGAGGLAWSCVAWIAYVGIGYWQWFVLCPRCVKAFVTWRNRGSIVESDVSH